MTLRILFALVWTFLLLAACLLPASWIQINEQVTHVGVSHLDKLAHLGLFGGFGLFWTVVGRSSRSTFRVIVVGFALAVLTELGQGLPMIRRDPDRYDVLADLVGLILGIGLAQVLRRWVSVRRERFVAEEVSV